MAITQTVTVENPTRTVIKYVDDAGSPAAPSINLGFVPVSVRYVNLTTRVEFEWITGMAATTTLKTVAAGTRTADTGSGIVLSGTTLTLAAPAQNDVCFIIASR